MLNKISCLRRFNLFERNSCDGYEVGLQGKFSYLTLLEKLLHLHRSIEGIDNRAGVTVVLNVFLFYWITFLYYSYVCALHLHNRDTISVLKLVWSVNALQKMSPVCFVFELHC